VHKNVVDMHEMMHIGHYGKRLNLNLDERL